MQHDGRRLAPPQRPMSPPPSGSAAVPPPQLREDGDGTALREVLALRADVERRLERMARRVEGVDHDLGALAEVYAKPARRDAEGRPTGLQPWCCGECGLVLGFYAAECQELRLRHRGVFVYVVPGPGGSLAATCEKCGALNRLVGDDAPVPEGVLAGSARAGGG